MASTNRVNLSGTILWTDNNGNTHPAREATVKIWDADSITDNDLVKTVRTDANGKYSATFNNDDGFLQGRRDIYVEVLADGPFQYVSSNGTKGKTYSQRSRKIEEISDGSHTIDLTINNSTDAGKAFSINDALYISGIYAKTVRGENLPIVGTKFPAGASQYTLFSSKQIELTANDWKDWDVITHEYGHFLADRDNLDKFPDKLPKGISHTFGQSNIGNLGISKDQGVRMGWSEGLASYLGTAAQNVAATAKLLPNVSNVGDTSYTDGEIPLNVDLEATLGSGNAGEGDEASVARILWDIADSAQDFFTSGLQDVIALGHQALYDVLNNKIPNLNQLDHVWDYFFNTSNDATRVNYGAIFEEYAVSPTPIGGPIGQTFQPGDAVPTFGWTKNNNNANDKFQLIVFNNDYSSRELEKNIEGDVTQWTPTQDQWNQIINTPGEHHFVIAGSDISEFETGNYWSGARNFFVAPSPSIVEFSQPNYQVDENGTVVGASVTLTRTGNLNIDSAVQVIITGGSATDGSDYDGSAFPLNVNFASNEDSKTVTIPIVQDILFEGAESINLEIISLDNVTIGTQNTAALEILDEDGPNGLVLRGGPGEDVLLGGNKDDYLDGGGGNLDRMFGGEGDDQIVDNNGVNGAHGGEGNDTIAVTFSSSWVNSNGKQRSDGKITGGYGDDTITVTMNHKNFFINMKGDEPVSPISNHPQDGNDSITLLGSYANSVVDLGGGNDIFTGGKGGDNVSGSGGRDTLIGGDGGDKLAGNDDDDILIGSVGNDTLIGGSGSDRFVLAKGAGTDTITDFQDNRDKIGLSGIAFTQLTITQGTRGNQGNTLISFNNGSNTELLAILTGVQFKAMTAADFINV